MARDYYSKLRKFSKQNVEPIIAYFFNFVLLDPSELSWSVFESCRTVDFKTFQKIYEV